jgi:7,8-dihydroneopterin aldolase/epimerase/oxygenase
VKDTIMLAGMSFYAYHGVSKAEQETGRKYEVDCEMVADLSLAGKSDRLDKTIDYSRVYKLIEQVITGKKCLLIEKLAATISESILSATKAETVTVRVRKLAPPIDGCVKHVEIEMTRHRSLRRITTKKK